MQRMGQESRGRGWGQAGSPGYSSVLHPGSSARVDIKNLTGWEPWSAALPPAPLFLVPGTSAVVPAWGNRVPSLGDTGRGWRVSIVIAGSGGRCWLQPGQGQGCRSSHLGAQDRPGILGMELESPPHSIPVSPPDPPPQIRGQIGEEAEVRRGEREERIPGCGSRP